MMIATLTALWPTGKAGIDKARECLRHESPSGR